MVLAWHAQPFWLCLTDFGVYARVIWQEKMAVPAKMATVKLNLCKQMLMQTFSRNRRANVRRCAGSHFPTAYLFTRPHNCDQFLEKQKLHSFFQGSKFFLSVPQGWHLSHHHQITLEYKNLSHVFEATQNTEVVFNKHRELRFLLESYFLVSRAVAPSREVNIMPVELSAS